VIGGSFPLNNAELWKKERNMWDMPDLLASLGKLALAAAVGGAIGFEREAHGQAAGLRTNILICVGACLMMQLSLNMEVLFRHLPGDTSVVRLDPGRIASYAIASMGFLGAGAIITGKGTVRGLTTAAGLWLVTGIGLAIGAGFLAPSLFAALISLICLYGMRQIKVWFHRDTYTILSLKYQGLHDHLELIKQILSQHGFNISFTSFRREVPNNVSAYRMHLASKENKPWDLLVEEIAKTPDLLELEWYEGRVL
jgi:putative Mg2+ transporter-C (MgtC) family protein